MSSLVSIDPGTKVLGWAWFVNRQLRNCGLVRAGSLEDMSEAVRDHLASFASAGLVVVEAPQVYSQRRQKGDPNDLIDIAIAGGMAAAALLPRQVEFVRPRVWKGTRPKRVCNALTREALNAFEVAILDDVDAPSSLMHNAIDAVGIGLWKLGRR